MSNQRTTNSYLPVPNPTTPYWRTDLHPLDSHRSTENLPAECDVLIIGAGISGVSVAYHLSQAEAAGTDPATSIVLLEARQVCSGATGRNGGHVKAKAGTIFKLAEQGRAGVGDGLVAFVDAHIDAFKDVVERERIDCEFELRRSYDVFLNEKDAASLRESWAHHSARGEPWMRSRQLVGAGLAESVSSVKGARAAVSSPACSMWPYKFVTQLIARTMDRNPALNLQTETPVLGVEYIDNGESGSPETMIHTHRGSIRAKKVVFATNGYTAGLLPQYDGVITPYKGTAAHLAPSCTKGPVFPHLSHTYNLEFGLDDRETVDYLNPRPDGGIVVGGGRWVFEKDSDLWHNNIDDSTTFNAITDTKYFERYMQRNFRGWEESGTEVDKIWTGIMASTPNQLPHAGEVPGRKNQWIIAGFNGAGMTMSFLLGKGVAQMVHDDLPFEEIDRVIPRFFKTTEARLAV
ncbi:putative FAD dependent oxidoreductase [Rosellinia necatrix]|uniref:Putative FAD dependent oxidoreductase n=1 Tax=Rosellinia necatrix TaxID=77044 RepID=A0A1W2TIU7_ROSNE|nr:putative FAD dependent oxidoreductase [Rosellinia necatrix]